MAGLRGVVAVLVATMAAMVVGPVKAQLLGSDPIRIVVPFPPGGTTDIMGRLMAEELRVALERTVLVDNVPGAGGRIGAERVARSPADGHTLLLGSPGPLASYQLLYKSMPYDAPTWDLTAILQAVRPQENYFKLSEPGTITVQDDGRTKFTPAANGLSFWTICLADQLTYPTRCPSTETANQ